VETGLIAPGTKVFDKKRRWCAIVRADGSLECEGPSGRGVNAGKSNAGQAGSIHSLGKDLQGAPSCNGWTFWHYEHGGEIQPIDAARELYRLANED